MHACSFSAGIVFCFLVGEGVDASRWHLKDRVAVRWLSTVCRACEYCKTSYENLCPHRTISGKDLDGCFAQYAIADAGYLARIPQGVSDTDVSSSFEWQLWFRSRDEATRLNVPSCVSARVLFQGGSHSLRRYVRLFDVLSLRQRVTPFAYQTERDM